MRLHFLIHDIVHLLTLNGSKDSGEDRTLATSRIAKLLNFSLFFT